MGGVMPKPRLQKAPKDYDEDDDEVIRAVDKWRTEHRRIPTVTTILTIVKKLGWQKQHGDG